MPKNFVICSFCVVGVIECVTSLALIFVANRTRQLQQQRYNNTAFGAILILRVFALFPSLCLLVFDQFGTSKIVFNVLLLD